MRKFLLTLMSMVLFAGLLAGPATLALAQRAAAASPTNLIANPLVETADPSNPSQPLDWNEGNWGTNSTTFSYLNSGSGIDTNSVQVQMTSYTSGDAKWYFNPVAVTAGQTYNYSDSYLSNVPTEVMVQDQTASGTLSYQDLGSAPADTSWATFTQNFTVPSGVTELTVFHLIQSVGTLQTDNFSLSPVSAPSVNISTPNSGATVSGSTTISANASDTNGIANVQFMLDGQALGSPITSAPYEYTWDTTVATNGSHSLTAVATNTEGISTTSAAIPVTVSNGTVGSNLISNPLVETVDPSNSSLPENWDQGNWGTNTVTFSYITNGSTGDSRSVGINMTAYTSGDAKWYFNPVNVTPGATYNYSDYYQSSVTTDVMAAFINASGVTTYQDLGSAAANPSAWTQYNASFIVPAGTQTMTVYHLISAVGTLQTDNFSLTESTKPSIQISAPVAGATVTGTTTVSANASDPNGITSVQFLLDGQALGSPVTSAPYQYNWDSTQASNGTHSLSAEIFEGNSVVATSSPVSVKVSNAGTNLVPNPKDLVVDPSNSNMPADWTTDTWGTNTHTFTYGAPGSGFDGSRSLTTKITSYTSGDSKWSFNAVPATKDEMYKFSEYYKATIPTQIDAAFNMSDGTTDYQIIGLPAAVSSWTKFTTEFAIPAGTQTIAIYHFFDSTGTLSTSDFSMTKYVPVGFSEPLVSLTFDDGYECSYTNTAPMLKAAGFTGTQFIITALLNQSGYLTKAQVKAIGQEGEEMASHTVDHVDLTQQTPANLIKQLANSQAALKTITGVSPTDLAYPFGLYNSAVMTATAKYYTAARSVDDGFNSKDDFQPYRLKVQNIYDNTTTAQVADWIAQAQATNTWLIITYHSVDDHPNPATDAGIYNITTAQFQAQLDAIKASGIKVVTMKQGFAETSAQVK
ncbi:MAG TPA: Ig-like domain-containing protein [Candidatus Saccharimonadales bacterium]|nr:Ig-like domain-containing protein [Candidatus Saccharimonadales bacterium]